MEKREEFEIPIIAFTPVMLQGGSTSTSCTVDSNNTGYAINGRTQDQTSGPSGPETSD